MRPKGVEMPTRMITRPSPGAGEDSPALLPDSARTGASAALKTGANPRHTSVSAVWPPEVDPSQPRSSHPPTCARTATGRRLVRLLKKAGRTAEAEALVAQNPKLASGGEEQQA